MTPAALIPFCAYQTNMTLLGQSRQDFPFTVCNKFQPSLIEGQLCYSLNLSHINNAESKSGLNNGLTLLIDQGPSAILEEEVQILGGKSSFMKFHSQELDQTSTKVYINTMARFTGYEAGTYNMYGLKKMTGTPSFLELPEDIKQCNIEPFEDCHARNYIEVVQKKCDCVPWALSQVVSMKVKKKIR